MAHLQRRRVIEALEARAAPDSIATVESVVYSLQNRVNSISLCITLNAKTGKIVPQFDVSFPEMLLKIVATRGEIFSLKFTKYTVWRPGSARTR